RIRIVVDKQNVQARQKLWRLRHFELIRIIELSGSRGRVNQRQANPERRTATLAQALSLDRSTMYFDEMPRDRQPESKTTMLSRRRAVSLSETFKNVRQKLRTDSLTGVRNANLNSRSHLRDFHAHAPAALRKLHCIRQQVPNHLLQPVGVSGNHRGLRVEVSLDPDPLRLGRLADHVDRVFDHGTYFHRL